MRLNEVLTEPTISAKQLRGNSSMNKRDTTSSHLMKHSQLGISMRKGVQRKDNSAILGQGIEAIVFQSGKPNQAGVARKWVRNQAHDVKNNSAIQYLIRSQQVNSTAIPRVYSIKQFSYPNGKYDFMVEMEKLSQTLKAYVHENISDPHIMYQLWTQVFDRRVVDKFNEGALTSIKSFNGLFTHAVSGEYDSKLNPNFRKGLDLVRNLVINDVGVEPDLHGGNFMIRHTSVGPQLVITDPLVAISTARASD